MQFVSPLDEAGQIDQVCQFLKDHLAGSVSDSSAPELKDFNSTLTALSKKKDYTGILKFILSKQAILGTLPTSHRQQHLTIQRLVLIVLPLFQILDSDAHKSKYEEVK
jgi:hypothetical protein